MTLLIVGGDSVESLSKRAAQADIGQIVHWSGRKARDLGKRIPRNTEAVVIVLDRISHALARKVRTEATRRRLPVFFQKRGWIPSAGGRASDLGQPFNL